MTKRLEGRNEPVLDPSRPIIDAHHHLYDRPGNRYLFEDLLADVSAGHNVVATVYVEARSMMRSDGPDVLKPLGEVEFANGVAAMSASGQYGPCRINAGIVGFADVAQGDAVAETLDRCLGAAPDRYRGIRQVTLWHQSDAPYRRFLGTRGQAEILGSARFREGFRHLAPRGLSFDAIVFHPQLPEVAALADAFPGTTIVLNHMGFAMGMDMDEAGRREVFRQWRGLLADVARRPNVFCKVGGLGMPFWGFGFDERKEPVTSEELAAAWKPYVETAIEHFSPARCMLESNFPPDGGSCGYVPCWNAFKLVTGGYAPGEKDALFHDTAKAVYRLAV